MKTIRLAKAEDASAMLAIYGPYIDKTPVTFEEVHPSVDAFASRIEESTKNLPWLVCEADGKLAGYAHADFHRERAAYRWSAECSVYVGDDHQRQGVARSLYNALFATLRLQNYFNLYAGITLPNAPSVAMHESMGFRAVGTYRNVGYKRGQWHDVGWWHLGLQAALARPAEPLPLAVIVDTEAFAGALRGEASRVSASI
jgi:L-amino acid N-acyltransferase YncA